MSDARRIERQLRALGDPEWAKKSMRFFKTDTGKYAESDFFVGIPVPVLRAEVKKRYPLPLRTTERLLQSDCHEIRLFALLMLVHEFERADNGQQSSPLCISLNRVSTTRRCG